MHGYFNVLLHPSNWLTTAELSHAPIQMHSLRAFWTLLLPWPTIALALYALTSIAALAIAVVIWKSSSPMPLKFSALMLAAILVNPHLFVYDLLALIPALLLLIDWTLSNEPSSFSPVLKFFLYLAFILPLFGPLSRWTHLQLSVIAFAAMLWTLTKLPRGRHAQSA
jgi:hypothetical protein